MCIADLRIARYVRSVSSLRHVIGTGFGELLRPSQQRVGFMVYGAATQTVLLSVLDGTDEVLIHDSTAFSDNHLFRLETHGDLVTKSIRAQAAAAPGVEYSVTEWFLPEQVLSEYLAYLAGDKWKGS